MLCASAAVPRTQAEGGASYEAAVAKLEGHMASKGKQGLGGNDDVTVLSGAKAKASRSQRAKGGKGAAPTPPPEPVASGDEQHHDEGFNMEPIRRAKCAPHCTAPHYSTLLIGRGPPLR